MNVLDLDAEQVGRVLCVHELVDKLVGEMMSELLSYVSLKVGRKTFARKQTKMPNNWQVVRKYFSYFHEKREAGQRTHDKFGRDILGP